MRFLLVPKGALLIFLFFLTSQVFAKTASRTSGRGASTRTVMNFVWKNPSDCKVDSLFQVILLEDGKRFYTLNQFWKMSSLCASNSASQGSAYLVKKALVTEVRRALAAVHKKRPLELRQALHSKEFQRFIIEDVQSLFLKLSRKEITQFSGTLSDTTIIQHLDKGNYTQYKAGDIRRLVEFHVHRSASNKTPEGNQWVHAAYGTIMNIGGAVGLVTRVTWGFEGDPRYEPRHANESIHGTFEVGLATLGNDKVGAEIVGIYEVGNHHRPNKLLALNLSWTPLEDEDLELALTAWVDQNYNEKFVGITGSYTYESHPFEPIVNLFKRLRLKAQMKQAAKQLKPKEGIN